MPKSYVPGLLDRLKRTAKYITDHQETLFEYITDPTVQADITNCANSLNSCRALINRPKEQP